MSYLPPAEASSREEHPACMAAITVRDMLRRTELGGREYYLYEGVTPSALLGKAMPGPLFRGLPNENTLPLIACRGAQAKAVITAYTYDRVKAPAVKDLIEEKFPELADFDVSYIIAPSSLDNYYSSIEREDYFNNYLPERPLSCRRENVGYFHCTEDCFTEPDQDWPLSDDIGYGRRIEATINCLKEELHKTFQNKTPYTFSAIPLERLMRELRLDCDYMELLQKKHLLEPGPVPRPTAFGRQCGLVVRLKLSRDGGMVDRELRVVPCAAEAFKQAIAFRKTIKEIPGQGLEARLRGADQWLPTSPPQAVIPPLLGQLKEAMKMPAEALENAQEKTRRHELIELFMHTLQPGPMADLRRLIDLTMAKLRMKPMQDDHKDLEDCRDDSIWHLLPLFTYFITSQGRVTDGRAKAKGAKSKGAASPGTLSERLKRLGACSVPIKDMELRHYFLAIACACDSTYPLWLCQEFGLGNMLDTIDTKPSSTIETAARKAETSFTAFGLKRFSYAMFLRPLTELPYKF